MKSLLACCCLLGLAGCARLTTTPLPAEKPAPAAESITYPAGTESGHSLLYHPAGQGPFPAVIVVHDDYGLTDWVKRQAERLADRGYLVLAVDLYHHQAVGDVMDAHIMSRGLPQDQVMAELKAAADYLMRHPNHRGDALGILGWGMGGGYALDAALQDARLRAVVTCYGRLTTDAKLLAPLQASVLGIFAGRDEGISPETIEQFRTAMRRAGKRLAGIHVYPECGHGFMNPQEPNPSGTAGADAGQAAADARGKMETFLSAELHPGRL
jgi:carboxymethylenebutenolidase